MALAAAKIMQYRQFEVLWEGLAKRLSLNKNLRQLCFDVQRAVYLALREDEGVKLSSLLQQNALKDQNNRDLLAAITNEPFGENEKNNVFPITRTCFRLLGLVYMALCGDAKLKP